MIQNEKNLSPSIAYDVHAIGNPEELLFFDIETTGLSVYRSSLYLIGYLYYDPSSSVWVSGQIFCESLADEADALKAFSRHLHENTILVSYNGDSFDLPFLKHMAAQYSIPLFSENQKSVDLLKLFRPLKKILHLENLKLKTCERALSIDREDPYSGKELIEMYARWQENRDPELLRILLLHNREDIENLPRILPLLHYRFLEQTEKTLLFQKVIASANGHAETLTLCYETGLSLPFPWEKQTETYRLHWEKCMIRLEVSLYAGELRYFYPDVENYYYLPAEDMAVHRSLASFVDAKHRKKATPKTCYQRQEGIFIPQPEDILQPVFLKEYKSADRFSLYRGQDLPAEDAVRYVNAVLHALLHEK
ncbi:MAG TPA: exonuclease [Oribacterium sp.]|nr:exonuclease [Oribacterium sp.]